MLIQSQRSLTDHRRVCVNVCYLTRFLHLSVRLAELLHSFVLLCFLLDSPIFASVLLRVCLTTDDCCGSLRSEAYLTCSAVASCSSSSYQPTIWVARAMGCAYRLETIIYQPVYVLPATHKSICDPGQSLSYKFINWMSFSIPHIPI